MMNSLHTQFYLTGGTAISRAFFNHRYSDDLDFFMNANSDFLSEFNKTINAIKDHCEKKKISFLKNKLVIFDSFGQCFIEKEDVLLKIDFINDIPERFGEIIKSNEYSNIDSLQNILSNKITALFRYEPKDIVDIWIITKNTKFNWKEMIYQAKEKEHGIEPIISADIIRTFPQDRLEQIKWTRNFDSSEIINDLNIISKEILSGSDNSICKTNVRIEDAKINWRK